MPDDQNSLIPKVSSGFAPTRRRMILMRGSESREQPVGDMTEQ